MRDTATPTSPSAPDTTTVTVNTPDGPTVFVPQETLEALQTRFDDLHRVVAFAQMHLFERDVPAAVDLLAKHGYGPEQAKALRSVIEGVRDWRSSEAPAPALAPS